MTSPVHEAILTIDCQGEQLTGVLSTPQADQAETGVLVVVGGPQYRIGSHRQFVLLARRLAASGYDCLRFDVRGMGDSGGAWRSFEQLDADIDAALDALCAARPMLRRVVLWGLCDGASAALLKLQVAPDARIAGLVLVNPWVRSALGLARTQLKHYYLQRLLQRSFWRKLLSGQVAGTAFSELLRSARLAWQASGETSEAGPKPFQQRMLEGLARFHGPVLILLSTEDFTAKEFIELGHSDPIWQAQLTRSLVDQQTLRGADHTFSNSRSQTLMENLTLAWLERNGFSSEAG